MRLTLLQGKIHRAQVTEANLDYEGSCAVDADLLRLADILPHQQIDIYNVTTGDRISTYAIAAPAGSGIVSLNGAAARRGRPGDTVIICAYAQVKRKKALHWVPQIVKVGPGNKPLAISVIGAGGQVALAATGATTNDRAPGRPEANTDESTGKTGP